MSVHSWCSDPARDEAVRAVEDNRQGPLPTLEQCIETARAMMPKSGSSTSAPEHENKVDGMRTERVTLEITMRAESYAPCRDLDWQRMLRQTPGGLFPGESVRVVEEAKGGMTHEQLDTANGHLSDMVKSLTAERDAALRERDEALAEGKMLLAERDDATGKCKMLLARVAELEAAPAASGAANSPAEPKSSEPVAWGVMFRANGLCFNHYTERFEADLVCNHINTGQTDYADCDVAPLYAAPQPPRGWLTAEERESVEILLDAITPSGCNIYRDEIATLTALLARSSPPEVVIPFVDPALARIVYGRDSEWLSALATAGVKVKEVGRE